MNIYKKKIHQLFNTKNHKEYKEYSDLCKDLPLADLIRLMPSGNHQVSANCWLQVRVTKTETTINTSSGEKDSNPALCLPAGIVADSKGITMAYKNINSTVYVYKRSEGRSAFNLDNRNNYRDVRKVVRDSIVSGAVNFIKKEDLVSLYEKVMKAKAEG